MNRDNDFRASGSGKIIYEELPKECLNISYEMFKKLNCSTMAFDFVKSNNSWVVLEMSYTYDPDAIYNCDFHYELPNFNKKLGKIKPQKIIIDNLIVEKNCRKPLAFF